jgi:peroxiredoxin
VPLQVGDPAPGFTLPHRPGETVDVGELIGREKVVLLFFPLAFSSVCTTEMDTIRDGWEVWAGTDARIFGISVDSPFVTAKFRDDERIPFPILSDFNKEVARAYGVLNEDLLGLQGVANRAAFAIDSDGRIAYAWMSEDPDVEPDYVQLLRAASAV